MKDLIKLIIAMIQVVWVQIITLLLYPTIIERLHSALLNDNKELLVGMFVLLIPIIWSAYYLFNIAVNIDKKRIKIK
jgi:hypothetical protein